VEDIAGKFHIALFRRKSNSTRKRFAVLEIRKSKIRVLDGDWDKQGIFEIVETPNDVNQALIDKLKQLYDDA